MKSIRKTMAFVLVVMTLLSVMAIPAMALENYIYEAVKEEVAAFPTLGYLSGDEIYVSALQAYLMRFNDTCRGKLKYGNTYIDGEYGGRTREAVAYAQSILNVSSDGICGSNTWGAISNSLVKNGTGVYRRYSSHGNCYIVDENEGTSQDGWPSLCYLDDNNAPQWINSLIY